MTHTNITQLVHNLYPKEEILSLEIEINQYNDQLDKLKIIFNPEVNPDLTTIGNLIEDINTMTINDHYGDMTELTFNYSTYEELPDGNLTVSFTFTPNIDS